MKPYLLVIAFVLGGCANKNNPNSSSADSALTRNDTLNNTFSKTDSLVSNPVPKDDIDEKNIQKAQVSKSDSLLFVPENIRKDYRIFGFANPDTTSKKLILFSVFTNDVQNNPFRCPLGAYYGTVALDSLQIKYKGDAGSFAAADVYQKGKKPTQVFFDKKWIEFTK